MRSVRDAAHYHPCATPACIEEAHLFLPPFVRLRTNLGEPLAAILRIPRDKLVPQVRCKQWECVDINAQHPLEPQILAHALVHHLLQEAAATVVGWVRAETKVSIVEHAPHAQDLEPLSLVRVD